MRKKLRIFSHIAIICLSVCMFAFGVYAANQVSVTTSGTVSFTATDVYATVTMGVNSTTKNTIADKSVTFQAGVAKDTETWSDTDIQFKDDGSNIVMTFTVRNNATDRPLYVYMRDDSAETTKFLKTIQNASSNYMGTEIEVAAEGSTTFTVTFTLADKNVSIQESDGIEYNLFINLASEKFIKGATFTSETSNSTYGKVSQVTKNVEAGTITLNATLEQNSEFLGWFEKSGETEGERIGDLLETTIPAKVGVTNYLAKFRTITKNNSSVISHTFNGDGTAVFGGADSSYSCAPLATSEGDILIIPAQIRKDTTTVYTVTAIGDFIFGYSANSATFKEVIIANTIEIIGSGFLSGATSVEEVVLPNSLKEIKNSAFCHDNSEAILHFVLPEGFTTLGEGVFKNYYTITIPSTLNVYSSTWHNSISIICDIVFNEGVSGETAVSMLNYRSCLEQMTIKSSSVLNKVEDICNLKEMDKFGTDKWSPTWNGNALFTIKVLKSLEETTPNAYLNNPENGFTKTSEGEYNVYTTRSYRWDYWTGEKVY